MRNLHKGLLFVSTILFIIAIYIIIKMIVEMAQGKFGFWSSDFWWAIILHAVFAVLASATLSKAYRRI